MNIKQILIDSGLMDSIGEYAYEEDNWEPVVSKFAELIVKECFNVVDNYGIEEAGKPEDKLGENLYVSMKITDAAWKIKEHFGIE